MTGNGFNMLGDRISKEVLPYLFDETPLPNKRRT